MACARQLIECQNAGEVDERARHRCDGNAAENGRLATVDLPRPARVDPSIRRSVGVVTSGAGCRPLRSPSRCPAARPLSSAPWPHA
jgi:hypothetical protein